MVLEVVFDKGNVMLLHIFSKGLRVNIDKYLDSGRLSLILACTR